MPNPFDDDAPGIPTPQAAPAAPPPADALPWGVVGRNTYRRLPQGRGTGVVREGVPAAVRFTDPQLPGVPGWTPAGDAFEMPLLHGPAQARSLGELGARTLVEFRAALAAIDPKNPRPADEAALAELDAVAARLAAAAEHLHGRGWGLGLLNPESVLVLGTGRDAKVVLPDLGFERDPMEHILPAWLVPNGPLAREWGNLWDAGRAPKDVHRCSPGSADAAQAEKERGHDLRKLARLLAWLLDGTARRDIPDRESADHTYAGVWKVLDDAVRGNIADAAGLRSALAGNPPSDHFRPDRVRRGRRPAGFLAGAACAAACLLAAAGVTWYATNGGAALGLALPGGSAGDGKPLADTSAPKDGTTFAEKVKAFKDADRLKARFEALQAAHRSRRSIDPEEHRREGDNLAAMRRELVQQIGKSLEALAAEAEAPTDLIKWTTDAEEIREILTSLDTYPTPGPEQKKDEDACLTVCRDLISRWRSARGA